MSLWVTLIGSLIVAITTLLKEGKSTLEYVILLGSLISFVGAYLSNLEQDTLSSINNDNLREIGRLNGEMKDILIGSDAVVYLELPKISKRRVLSLLSNSTESPVFDVKVELRDISQMEALDEGTARSVSFRPLLNQATTVPPNSKLILRDFPRPSGRVKQYQLSISTRSRLLSQLLLMVELEDGSYVSGSFVIDPVTEEILIAPFYDARFPLVDKGPKKGLPIWPTFEDGANLTFSPRYASLDRRWDAVELLLKSSD